MRSLLSCLLAATALAGVSSAYAADLDYGVLRGPEEEYVAPVLDWSGFYIGGHGGYSSANFSTARAFQDPIGRILAHTIDEAEFALSSWLAPADVRAQTGSYGAIAGYNMQFDDFVLGVEADYTHSVLRGGSADHISRYYTTSDGYFNTANLSGLTHTSLTDYGTIRARAGYAIGSFLPFVTGGAAFGRAMVSDAVAVDVSGYDKITADANLKDGTHLPVGTHNILRTTVKSGERYTFGFSAGAGLDYAVTSNIVLRAEYQYIQFNDFDSHKINLNTVRAAAIVKF